jgi:outer membrane protein
MKALSFFFLGFLISTANANSIKIGYIDIDNVLRNLTIYQDSVNRITLEFEPKKQELLDLFNHMELIRVKIESRPSDENSKSMKEEISNLVDLEEIFKTETEFWQKEMNNKKLNLLNEIQIIVNQAVNSFALEEGYDLILYENVAFASNKVNISKQIITKIEVLSK